MKRIITFVLILILAVSVCNISASAEDLLPAPDWITIEQNSDGTKTLKIQTPIHMLDRIDYYEYSTDKFASSKILNDSKGGEFLFDDTCEFSLRYACGELKSEIYTVNIEITTVTVITNRSTNISILIPRGSPIPTDVNLSAYEIINGKDYSTALNLFGNINFRLFNVSVMRNNKEYVTDEPYIFLFPADKFDATQCNIYHMDSKGNINLIAGIDQLNMIACQTETTGLFIVTQDGVYCNGDVDGDGFIMAKDARLALRISAELDDCNDSQFRAGDLNKNNMIDASDARLILRKSASLEA